MRVPARMLQGRRKVLDINEFICRGHGSAREHVFQLSNIPRPIVLEQHDLRPPRQSMDWFRVALAILFQKVANENGNVLGPFRQTWYAQFNRAKPKEKIFAKPFRTHLRAQVAIRSCNEPDVHFLHFRRADTLNFAALNYSEQLCLHGQRCLPDFVEKHRSAVCVFE